MKTNVITPLKHAQLAKGGFKMKDKVKTFKAAVFSVDHVTSES